MVRDPSTSCSASELIDHYDTTLRSLLDVHSPVKTQSVSEQHELLRGMTTTVGVRRKKPVVLRSFTDVPKQKVMKVVASSV